MSENRSQVNRKGLHGRLLVFGGPRFKHAEKHKTKSLVHLNRTKHMLDPSLGLNIGASKLGMNRLGVEGPKKASLQDGNQRNNRT